MGIDSSTAPLFPGTDWVVNIVAGFGFDECRVKVGVEACVPLMLTGGDRPVDSGFLK
jgi:hypothetical protein